MDKPKTILLVDDDEDYRFQQRIQLQGAGYKVIEADSKEAAEELLERVTPDLAIVDLMMEELDAGFTLCYHIKKRTPELPVILVTAVTHETGLEFDAATREERSWVKADAMLAKPIRFDQLRREIEKHLK
jgi:CheY-like chemotaxis protein